VGHGSEGTREGIHKTTKQGKSSKHSKGTGTTTPFPQVNDLSLPQTIKKTMFLRMTVVFGKTVVTIHITNQPHPRDQSEEKALVKAKASIPYLEKKRKKI